MAVERDEVSALEISELRGRIKSLEENRVELLEKGLCALRKELKDATGPNWSLLGSILGTFIAFMILYTSLIFSVQNADTSKNARDIAHANSHIDALQQADKDIYLLIERIQKEARETFYTKEDHEIFDKERAAQLHRIEERIQYLERNGKK
jgi:hypothetical protein